MAESGVANATAGAKEAASERGIDLDAVPAGTGKDGSITKDDVVKFADDQDSTAAAQEAVRVYEVSLSNKRTALEVIAYLDGERRSFTGGETVTGDERDELSGLKGEALDGSDVQLLTFKEVK